jgi:hypothetical protein
VENWNENPKEIADDILFERKMKSKSAGFLDIHSNDMFKASILREKLEDTLDEINESVSSIHKEMSGFNAPGMKKAFFDSIMKGMNKHTNMFMIDSAKRELGKYYDREGK